LTNHPPLSHHRARAVKRSPCGSTPIDQSQTGGRRRRRTPHGPQASVHLSWVDV